jgi:CRP/FNR family cyclic AMP-dependent transcriptional regulator
MSRSSQVHTISETGPHSRVPLGALAEPGQPALQPEQHRPNDERGQSSAAGSTINLARVLPTVLAVVPPEDRQLAERTLIVPLITGHGVDLTDVIGAQASTAFGFVIVDGVVLKETTLAQQSALELLGPGDLLAPPLSAGRQLESQALSRYLAHGPVSLAVIETHFRLATRRWPGIADVLLDRLGLQAHRTSQHLAMLHLPRVEDRIAALFTELAERFGRVTPEGILIDLPLTHDVIGGLVASRRPTATIALQKLAADGLLERLDDKRWKLARRILSA